MKKRLENLIRVKSLVTLSMTVALIVMLVKPVEPTRELLTLFCTSYGAIITFFFTRKDNENPKSDPEELPEDGGEL